MRLFSLHKKRREGTMTLQRRKVPAYKDYIKGIKDLKPEEQLSLVEIISAHLKRTIAKRKHSIMELEGLGAEIWKDVDVQEYIKKERESWD